MRLDVPAHKQEEPWTCLPACVRMCLAWLDITMDEAAISARCGTSRAGTSIQQAARAVRGLGLEAETRVTADLDWLFDHLAADEPVIVSWWMDLTDDRSVRHAVVVIGADETEIHFLDPASGTAKSLPILAFLRRWELGGKALVVARA